MGAQIDQFMDVVFSNLAKAEALSDDKLVEIGKKAETLREQVEQTSKRIKDLVSENTETIHGLAFDTSVLHAEADQLVQIVSTLRFRSKSWYPTVYGVVYMM